MSSGTGLYSIFVVCAFKNAGFLCSACVNMLESLFFLMLLTFSHAGISRFVFFALDAQNTVFFSIFVHWFS